MLLVSDWHTKVLLSRQSDDPFKQTFEDLEKLRKEQHRITMVAFRLNKKHKHKEMQREHRRLEREMKALASKVRAKNTAKPINSVVGALSELIVESEALKEQNAGLRKGIGGYNKFQTVVLENQSLLQKEEEGLPDLLQFHALSRDEFNATMENFDSELSSGMSPLSMIGSCFGWQILRAPMVPSPSDNTRISVRARTTKRLHCSLDVQQRMLHTKKKDLSPVLLKPMGWGLRKQSDVSTQMLQEFDQDSVMFEHSIPELEKTLRFFFQLQRVRTGGRGQVIATMVVVGKAKHSRSLVEEGEWATEGGMQMSITEVDENLVDISCDHWTSCENELQAKHLVTQWAQFSTWWEQLTAPFNLIQASL